MKACCFPKALLLNLCHLSDHRIDGLDVIYRRRSIPVRFGDSGMLHLTRHTIFLAEQSPLHKHLLKYLTLNELKSRCWVRG
jgi:hypothetical protein